jgi:hypothetical protein
LSYLLRWIFDWVGRERRDERMRIAIGREIMARRAFEEAVRFNTTRIPKP